MKDRVVAIVGPTASGKTSCAVEICKELNGEVISADSMQIYREMSIGTALPSEDEKQGIAHHMLGFVSPDEKYNVSLYKQDAAAAINDIIKREKLPVIAGGTGLYINSITYNLDFTQTASDEKLRADLSDEYDSDAEAVYKKLTALDPEAAQRIHINDKKRVIRRLEICMRSGGGEYDFSSENDNYDFIIIGLNKQRDKLYEDINRRVDVMMQNGLEQEAYSIFKKYGAEITAFSAIGYKEFLPYFNAECALNDVVEKIKQNTRHFAKRQLTWFKRDKRIKWYYADQYDGVNSLCRDIIDNEILQTERRICLS